MAKNFFQDMIKMKSDIRRELGESDSPAVKEVKREKKIEAKEPVLEVKQAPEKTPEPIVAPEVWPPMVENRVSRQVELGAETASRRPRYSLWIVAGTSLVFLFFAVSFLFAKAYVTIIPRVERVSLNENYSAIKDTAAGESIAFDLISLPGEEVRMVEGGGITEVSRPARGLVVIYNNFSAATQRLDINTRLEGSNGKIYKTVEALTVPGMKGATPGSVEVEVYGAEPGDSYNSGPLDFQIFGFKGTPKYSKFYARSKGDLAGGFIGEERAISEEQKRVVQSDMQGVLRAKLIARARDLIPEGFILFEDAITFTLESTSYGASETDSSLVPVTLKGTLSGFLFDEGELAKKVANTTLSDYDGSEVYIANLDQLSFTLLSLDQSSGALRTMTFNLAGSPEIVWSLEPEKILGELAGRGKDEFNQILSQYPNVVGADVVLRPVWRRSFPDEADKITIEVKYPENE